MFIAATENDREEESDLNLLGQSFKENRGKIDEAK